MPVTAKLSRRFYETFGDEIANEPVEWINSVDATTRADLRELNELNFSRFDAKLEQRIAELRQEMAEGFASIRQELTLSVGGVRRDLTESIAGVRQELTLSIAGVRQELTQSVAAVRAE